jgi:hypothetical protein
MPTAEAEACEAARAARDAGENEIDAFNAAYERALAERHERLKKDACASYRAMEGWRKILTPEQWEETVRQAHDDFDSGHFLLERLGAERYLDPPLAAVLIGLRRRLIKEYGASTATELMLVDSALLAYYHQLRINGWLGDMAGWMEREFFAKPSLTATIPGNNRREFTEVRGLSIDYIVERIIERLMPLLDRSNRMLLRNLKALKAMRQAPAPNVSIGSAGQVNVAAAQANTIQAGEDLP